jgi:hypothetical protein
VPKGHAAPCPDVQPSKSGRGQDQRTVAKRGIAVDQERIKFEENRRGHVGNSIAGPVSASIGFQEKVGSAVAPPRARVRHP